ncbi:MAG: hypothetical protein ABI596_13510 [Pyrinomonadaceae bacterium]
MTAVKRLSSRRWFATISTYASAFALTLLSFNCAWGQSTEQEAPTPIRAGDINAAIAVRDLGDPRLTRHFYIFTGVPGDLIVSVESKNLDGDVDIFTAAGLRPLVKMSLYASEVSAKTTKSIYLRTRQDLILRVEARSPNEEPGSYRLQFGGSFEPFSGEINTSESASPESEAPTLSASKKGRRVSAVGARIDEPPAPIEEKAASEQPATDPSVSAAKTEPATTEAPAPIASGKKPVRVRPTRPNPRTSRARPEPTSKVETPARDNPASSAKPAEEVTRKEDEKPAAQVETAPRLIIETTDGETIERSMNTVRRVVVDNGQIIVIMRTGKIERFPMITVARMSIQP